MYEFNVNSYKCTNLHMGNNRPFTAVLTADIVNSTKIPPLKEKKLLKELEKALTAYAVTFYRGDSFQVFMKSPEKSLRIALICRTLVISLMEEKAIKSDIRISIGIGSVEQPVKMPGTARGEAFVISGQGLDIIQGTEQRLLIRSGHAIADVGFQVIADYLDNIYRQMTAKQASVILDLLQGRLQKEVAFKQEKSISTISQFASSGRWSDIERLLQQFEQLINQLI